MGAAAAAVGAVAGGVQFFQGREQERKAQAAIDSFKAQDLVNPFEDLQVSTLGAELQREEAARLGASQVEAIRGAGTRGIIGGLWRQQAALSQVTRQTGADLDRQQKQIDFAEAEDKIRTRAIQEQRERDELAGLGQQLATGQALKYQGIGTFVQGLGTLGSTAGGSGSNITGG